MGIVNRLKQLERAAQAARARTARTVIRVSWPDGRITGPETAPGDRVIALRVAYDGSADKGVAHGIE